MAAAETSWGPCRPRAGAAFGLARATVRQSFSCQHFRDGSAARGRRRGCWRFRRGRERCLRALALLVRDTALFLDRPSLLLCRRALRVGDLALFDSDTALPIGEPSKDERDGKPGGKTTRVRPSQSMKSIPPSWSRPLFRPPNYSGNIVFYRKDPESLDIPGLKKRGPTKRRKKQIDYHQDGRKGIGR